ncbi:hypothetical protein F7725_005079, partial [Dissostichus mawsoni]
MTPPMLHDIIDGAVTMVQHRKSVTLLTTESMTGFSMLACDANRDTSCFRPIDEEDQEMTDCHHDNGDGTNLNNNNNRRKVRQSVSNLSVSNLSVSNLSPLLSSQMASPQQVNTPLISNTNLSPLLSSQMMVCPAAGEHPLQFNYSFWFSRRTPSRPSSSTSYEQNIRHIGSVSSVEQFWRFYSHLVRPGDLSGHSDFHLFKEGIKPMWEVALLYILQLHKEGIKPMWEVALLYILQLHKEGQTH